MPPEMDLRMRILARGDQALAVLKRVQGMVAGIARVTAGVGSFARRAFGVLRSVAEAALRPLKLAAASVGVIGLALVGIGAKAVSAAGEMEALQLRLEGVSASAKQARDIFAETVQLSVASPFEPGELVDARIGLLNLGLVGRDAITAIGDAASITQKPLADLVSVIAGMESEPLRRIGITLRTEMGKYTFTYRDKMQEVKTITAQGVDEARKSLLSIFDIKYGGGMSKFAGAMKGLWSTLQGNIKLAFSSLGEGLMPAAKRFVDAINTRLSSAQFKDVLTEIGFIIGDKLMAAWDFGAAVIEKAQYVITALGKSPEALGKGLEIVLRSGGELIGIGFATYLKGMGEIFAGIGKIIAGAFMEDALQLPGMKRERYVKAVEAIRGMDDATARAFGITDLMRTQSRFVGATEFNFGLRKNTVLDDFLRGLSPEQQAAIAASGRGRTLQAGFDAFTRGLPALSAEALQRAKGVVDAASSAMGAAATGYMGPTIDQLMGERQAVRQVGRAASGAAGAAGPLHSYDPYAPPEFLPAMEGGGAPSRIGWRSFSRGGRTVRRMGQGLSGFAGPHDVRRIGGSISINNLTIRADSAQRLRNDLIKLAGAPAMAAAGS